MLVEALEYMGHRAYTGPSKAELVERRLPSASLRRTGGKVLRQIEEAYGTAGKAKELAAAIEASTKLARAFLKDTSEQAKLRRKGTRITLAWLTEADSVAEKVRKTGSSAGAVIASTAVSQAEVDYWDGINLRLLELVFESFDVGHAADPTIPRLPPRSLANYFSPSRKARKPDGEAKKDASTAEPAKSAADANAKKKTDAEAKETEDAPQ